MKLSCSRLYRLFVVVLFLLLFGLGVFIWFVNVNYSNSVLVSDNIGLRIFIRDRGSINVDNLFMFVFDEIESGNYFIVF